MYFYGKVSSMITEDEVIKLASLARISITEASLPKIAKEFGEIVNYISMLDDLALNPNTTPVAGKVRNVFREDENAYERKTWTKKIIEQFPHKQDNSLTVKKIISHD
jgi:aspartyl-tRNA(Asn)/glutamyl-tRNA(Gln) amidotransferase subunit C